MAAGQLGGLGAALLIDPGLLAPLQPLIASGLVWQVSLWVPGLIQIPELRM